MTSDKFEKLKTKIDHLASYNRNLKVQMGQLANSINSHSQGNLPSKIEVNPKEHCKAVTLRNGKKLDQVSDETMVDEEDGEQREVSSPAHKEQVEEESEQVEIEHKPPPVKPYVPPIPFPQRLKQNKVDKQFEKFLEVHYRLISVYFACYFRIFGQIFIN